MKPGIGAPLRPRAHQACVSAAGGVDLRALHQQPCIELARLHGTDTVDSWLMAARDWDQLDRPHDSAYCRWRAAQVALREGRGTLAVRLLRKAAVDAREHVPLSEAIARAIPGAQ